MEVSRIIYISRMFDLKRDDGLRRRFLLSLEGLSKICNKVDCIFFSSKKLQQDELNDFKTELRKFNVDNVGVIYISSFHKLRALLASLFGRYYRTLYGSKSILNKVKKLDFFSYCDYSLAFSNYFYLADIVEKLSGSQRLRKIVDLVDAVSLHMIEAINVPLSRRLSYKILSNEVKLLEKKAIMANDICFVTTEKEKSYFGNSLEIKDSELSKVKIIWNYVDQELIEFGQKSYKKYEFSITEFNIAFIGDLSYFPNEQAALRLIEIFNKFCEHTSKLASRYHLLIIGKGASKKLQKVASKFDQVRLMGYVDDLRKVCEKIHLFVLPMKIASGIQNKLLTGLALGIPTMISSRARFTEELIDGENVIFADSEEEYISKLKYYQENPEELKRISVKANAFAKKYLSKEEILKEFIEIIKQ